MVQNLYKLWDKVSNSPIDVGAASTDGAYMRSAFPQWTRVHRLEDLAYYQIGTWNPDTDEVKSVSPRLCPMDAYKFPENTSRALSSEEIRKLAEHITRQEALKASQQ